MVEQAAQRPYRVAIPFDRSHNLLLAIVADDIGSRRCHSTLYGMPLPPTSPRKIILSVTHGVK